ncbi:hypothetical protein GGF42_000741 [Coemansia sp. RSA 2424]|nr:hypothetical protein GGF42_000741 [Coemansia sp. RSA 2424]
MWSELCLIIDPVKHSISVSQPQWAKRFKMPADSANLVREVHVNIPWPCIIDGSACKLLEEFMRDTANLPLVHKLRIIFNKYPPNANITKDDAISNGAELARLLKSKTRDAFTSVEVVCLGGTMYMHNFVERAFGALVESLCGNSKRSMIDLGMVRLRYADTVGQIPQLSSLSLTSYNVDDFRTALMHKSAATLLDLNIGICIPKALIYDANGNAVIYPNLSHLKVFPRDYDRTVQRVLSPGITPFPALTSLRLSLTYPFGDDVFFRGNSSTLEYLKIIIDSETAIMLSTSSAFDHPFRKLRRVDIGESHDFGDLAAIPEANIKNLLRNLMGAARGVRFSSALYLELLVTAAPRIRGFEHVQDLHFYMAKLSLFDVIRVVGVLPGLTKLACGINGVGSEFNHIPARDLPDHIVATYGTKGNSLCELSTDLARGVNIMEAANFAMLLALACPKLSKIGSARVAPPPVYYAKITKSLGRKPFNKYASQLKRLLGPPADK